MSSAPLPAAGLHPNVPFHVYSAWDAVNHSTLKQMRPTPAHCRHAMDNPKEETPAMQVGSALHHAVFEPGEFAKYVVEPDMKRPTVTQLKAHQKRLDEPDNKKLKPLPEETIELIEFWAQWDEANKGRPVLSQQQHDAVSAIADGIRRNKAARKFIDAPGQCEVSAVWEDDATALWCKARLDRLAQLKTTKVLVDIKSTVSADKWAFAKRIADFHYDSQIASYLDAYKILTGEEIPHVILAVENHAPFECAVYMLEDQDLQTGRRKYRKWLDDFAACVATGEWPGYSQQVETIHMPSWAQWSEAENLTTEPKS